MARLEGRVPDEKYRRWKAAADMAGVSVTALAVRALDRESERILMAEASVEGKLLAGKLVEAAERTGRKPSELAAEVLDALGDE